MKTQGNKNGTSTIKPQTKPKQNNESPSKTQANINKNANKRWHPDR